jgi:hypothetical protein
VKHEINSAYFIPGCLSMRHPTQCWQCSVTGSDIDEDRCHTCPSADLSALLWHACTQGLKGRAQHGKQAKHQQLLLAMVDEHLKKVNNGPVTAAFLKDLEHEVDDNLVAVPAWSTTVTKARFKFAQLLR